MADFRVGDVVRLKKDEPERLNLVLVKFDGQGAFGVSECGRRRTWAAFGDCELVNRPDQQADMKQAIREVLLSDEFMAKFAAAWMKTPIPIANPYDTRERERIRSLADYPFREPSEGLAVTPITGSESEAYYLEKLKKGEAK